jgi:hypothetical protein
LVHHYGQQSFMHAGNPPIGRMNQK